MSNNNEIWLVSGGQPGAERFGQLVQRLRKEQHTSVKELADNADLSVGTIRAIEQGRRAPSEESGIKILQLLLPPGSLVKGNLDHERPGLNYSFTDPRSGSRILIEFGAKTAGDNRRWSVDKPPVGESQAEAFMRELMNDPKQYAEWLEKMRPALDAIASAVADAKRTAELPVSDATLGRLIRRLVNINEFRVERLTSLLNLWDHVDSGTADAWVREHTSQVDRLLDGYQEFPDGVDIVDAR